MAEPTYSEKKFLEHAKAGDLNGVKEYISKVNVNCKGEEGMTALMYASYKGILPAVEYLLQNGADPNIDSTKDQYTPLMFATLSGSTDTVRTLLEAGAKPDAVNKIKRTATQLGAFVGRHDCVSVINNFVETDQIKYYTKKHGLETSAKLDGKLADSLHKMVVIPNLNPIKLVLFIQENLDLLQAPKEVVYVLETEVDKSFKDVNEVLAIKLHVFTHVFKKCVSWETGKEGKLGIKGFLKFLLKPQPEDGFLTNVEMLLRDSMKTFPYTQSNLFKQIIKTMASTKVGTSPSSIAILTQSINGMQSADFSECCTCCGDRHRFNKCSACKMVRYCNATCQKLHWPAHKNFCKLLREQYEERMRIEKSEKEQEEKLKQVKQEQQNIEVENTMENNEEDEFNENMEELNLDDTNTAPTTST